MTFDCKGHSFLWKGTERFLSAWWGNHDAIIAIFFIFIVTAAFFGFGMSESASLYSCGLQHVCLFLCQTLESYVRFSCSVWYLSWFFVLFLYIWNQCWAVVFKAHACVCAYMGRWIRAKWALEGAVWACAKTRPNSLTDAYWVFIDALGIKWAKQREMKNQFISEKHLGRS